MRAPRRPSPLFPFSTALSSPAERGGGGEGCAGARFLRKRKKFTKNALFPLAKGPLFLYKFFRCAEVAQLVEQGTENPRVGSSILSLGTIK